MTVPVGEPSTASTAATAAATRHFEQVERVEFVVAMSHRILSAIRGVGRS
jgi:hypothetical protein